MPVTIDPMGMLRNGRRTVVAVVVEVEGSAPLPTGSTMLVDEDGRIEGSVTGGCVESAVAQTAEAILHRGAPARVETYGISDDLAGTVGLMCGGTVHVFVGGLAPAALAALEAFDAAVEAGEPAGLATLLDGEHAGARLALAGGTPIGTLGQGRLLDRNVAADLDGLIGQGRSTLLRYAADGSRLGAEQRVFLHAHAPAPQLIVVGAIDFSAALAPIAAQLGYRVTIVEPRSAFARSPRFARHVEVAVAWPDAVIGARELGPRDAVLVFSHDPKLDEPAIRAALASGAGYVGALGSRRTAADRAERLRATGVTDEQLARVHAPCGLDIGSITAEETAISVLAELIAQRSGRDGSPLRDSGGTIRPVQHDAPPARR
jgi:xanthine dehydrogenase accessory factor